MTRASEGKAPASRKAAVAAGTAALLWMSAAAATPQAEKSTPTRRPVPGHLAPGAMPAPGTAHPNRPPRIDHDPDDTEAARALLREAVVVGPQGRHHRLLRALRFLEDPALAPLFSRLRDNDHAALRVHGLLGSAELASPRGVTTEDLVDLERDDQRAEVVRAALDGGLLNEATRDRLLAWPGLTHAVKLQLATSRVAAGRVAFESPAHAATLAALGHFEPTARVPDHAGPAPPDNPWERRGLAALLLHQIGDARGTQELIALNNADTPHRDTVRATLLDTARRHRLHRAGPWAYSIASEPDLPPRLEALALEVAAGFGDPRAHRHWAQQFGFAHQDLSARTRLALAGLRFATAAEPELFNVVAVDSDPFVATVGRTARALAGAAPDFAAAAPGTSTKDLIATLHNLHATHHPLAHAWLASFATDPATPDRIAETTAHKLVTGFRPGQATGRSRRLQAVCDAVETLLRRAPDTVATDLPDVLAHADPAWSQALLLGLVRSRIPTAATIGRGLSTPRDPGAQALILVLRLRSGGTVAPELRPVLTQVLQGRTTLDDELRVQAAWAYLKRTGEARALLLFPRAALTADAVARTPNSP